MSWILWPGYWVRVLGSGGEFRTRAGIDNLRLASLFRCLASWVQAGTSDRGQDSNQDATKKRCPFNGIGVNSNAVVVDSLGTDANLERMCSKPVRSRADLIELLII